MARLAPEAGACRARAALFVFALGLAACAAPASRDASSAHVQPLTSLHREDAVWLERASFGLDSDVVADYQRLGRERYLDAQLQGSEERLAAPVALQIHMLENSQADPATTLQALRDRRKAIDAMTDGADKEQARRALTMRATGSPTRPSACSSCARCIRPTSCASRWSGSG